jgi:hypothetical protein
MKSFWSALRFWVRDTFASRDHAVAPPDSLAKTIKDASHVRGGRGGMARSSSEEVHQHAVEGHDEYQKSFKKRK